MSDVNRWFCLRIQAELVNRRWSVREISRRADCSPSTFVRLKNNYGTSLEIAVRIAEALGKPLDELVAPVDCGTCHNDPPAGFTCQTCGSKHREFTKSTESA